MLVFVISGSIYFLFNDPATTEIYTYGHTLSLHGALPISGGGAFFTAAGRAAAGFVSTAFGAGFAAAAFGSGVTSFGAGRGATTAATGASPVRKKADRKSTRLNSSH